MIDKRNFYAIGKEAFDASLDMMNFVADGDNCEDIHVRVLAMVASSFYLHRIIVSTCCLPMARRRSTRGASNDLNSALRMGRVGFLAFGR